MSVTSNCVPVLASEDHRRLELHLEGMKACATHQQGYFKGYANTTPELSQHTHRQYFDTHLTEALCKLFEAQSAEAPAVDGLQPRFSVNKR